MMRTLVLLASIALCAPALAQKVEPGECQMGPDCKVTPGKQGADSYRWQMACPQSGMRGSGTMRWTRTTMDIDMDMASEKQGQKVEMRSRISGKRIGPCKG